MSHSRRPHLHRLHFIAGFPLGIAALSGTLAAAEESKTSKPIEEVHVWGKADSSVQTHWDINAAWNLDLGVRYEQWRAENGYISQGTSNALVLEHVPSRQLSKTSPKFSLSYTGWDAWTLRYSLAKAYRFPIIEELYSQYSAFNSASIADPGLAPEDGVHHNLMLNNDLNNGYWRINLFHDDIQNQIESFTDVRTNVRTFHSMGDVETTGMEFVLNLNDVLTAPLDVRFNLTHIFRAEIVDNPSNPNLEGKDTVRLPDWRVNLLSTYRLTPQWNASLNVEYASKAFLSLDNSDIQWNVYGAQDAYTRIGLKTDYHLRNGVTLGLGIDNLTNAIDYIFHPWPGRTVYANASYQF